MGNISSISLTDTTLRKKILDLHYDNKGIEQLVTQGIIIATTRALYLSGIMDYKWEIFDTFGKLSDHYELQMFKVSALVSRIEDIMVNTPTDRLGYSIWIIQNTNMGLQYQCYTLDTSFAMSSLLQGIMTMIKYFNLKISDVFVGKIIRLSIRDGQYIANYFDIENVELPTYNFTNEELVSIHNGAGNNDNSMVDRLDNIRKHMFDRYELNNQVAPLLGRLNQDAKTILRYTLEQDDNFTMAKYINFIREEKGSLDDFLTKYELI